MNKYIDLLKSIPENCFNSFGYYMIRIIHGMPAYKSDVVRCYHLLGQAFDKNSKYINMPKVRYVPRIDRYSTLDYINPHYNHIYKDVYGHKFSLPKMYRNVFTNTQPSTRMIEIKPKQGVSFQEVSKLRDDFIKVSHAPVVSFYLWTNDDYKEHLDKCYNALVKLLQNADLIYNNQTQSNNKGSVILAQELNNLLFNQNMLAERYQEISFAPNLLTRAKIMADIREHKEAMFGEIKHQYKNNQR